jgi:hypothetical protein
MDDAPAEIEIGGQKVPGQIVSVQGSEVAVGIESDFGKTIAQARLITNLWYLLEALRKRFEEALNGQRALDTRLARRLFGLAPTTVASESGGLDLPPSPRLPNDEQLAAIRAVCGSDVHYIWGPPGTGKTQTIGFLVAALLRRSLRVLVVSHTNVATDHAIRNAAELLLDSEDYQSGKLVRFGNISPNVSLPDMVIPDKIVERLGQDLRQRLRTLQAGLAKVESELSALRGVEALLTRRKDALLRVSGLDVNLRRCSQEHDNTKSRRGNLLARLQQEKAKLSEAQNSGRLKRLLRGLDPVKLQVQIANTEAELAVAERSVAAGTSKLGELRASLETARSEEQRYAKESEALLSGYGLDQIGLSARIGKLSKRAEEDAPAIRAVEAELEALLSKILSQAKVIATTLTKATISKQFDEQKFDALVLDEASMAPMPSVFFAAGRATQKAVAVGDFRQLPPICVADGEMAKKWLGRDIFGSLEEIVGGIGFGQLAK